MVGLHSAGEEPSLQSPLLSELRASDAAFHPAGPAKRLVIAKRESK